jgi:hypothetical protein
MIPNSKNPNSGRPKLPIPLTMEQDFKMRVIEDNLRKHYNKKEDVITVFLALQRQNFALSNALKDFIENSIII